MAGQGDQGSVAAAANRAEEAIGDAAKAVKEIKMTKQLEVVMVCASFLPNFQSLVTPPSSHPPPLPFTAVSERETLVVLGVANAVADDQGMMSLVNTNKNYLKTMGIGPEDPMVAVIVSVRV